MFTLLNAINYLLPILSLLLLVTGIATKRTNYVLIAFWLSLLAFTMLYRAAGGEILGRYFGYLNATFYSINLFVLIAGTLYIFFNIPFLRGKYIGYATALVSACLITGGVILSINLWVNAYFIETRLPNSAIIQVVSFTPPQYCSNRYVFYKVGSDKKIAYLCPNHYGLIPKIGHLEVAPEFLVKQMVPR